MSNPIQKSSALAHGLSGYETAIKQAYAPMAVDPERPGDSYEWLVDGRNCGPLRMSRIVANGRIRACIERNADSEAGRKIILTFVEHGCFEFEQDGRQARCTEGSLVLMDIGRALDARQDGALEIVSLILPAQYLHASIPGFESLCTESLPAAAGTAAMLRDLLKSGWREGGAVDAEEGRALLRLFTGMIESVFSRQDRIAAAQDSQLAAMHRRIQDVIKEELQNPSLSPRLIAERLDISTSYLFAVARRFGTSIRQSIIDRRLEACREVLADPGWSRRTLLEIAFNWGFQDVSHFSRRFSQRYGISPGRYREMREFELRRN